jgi:hypothetical protein
MTGSAGIGGAGRHSSVPNRGTPRRVAVPAAAPPTARRARRRARARSWRCLLLHRPTVGHRLLVSFVSCGPAAVANEADTDVTVTFGRPGLRAPDAVTAPPAVPPAAAGLPDVPRPRRHRTGGAGGLFSPAVSCSFPTISATSAGGTAARRSAPSTGRLCWRATSIPNTTASGPRRPRHTRPRRRDRGGRPTRRPPPLPGDLRARLAQERPIGRAVHRHPPHLVLVTCGGAFDEATRRYADMSSSSPTRPDGPPAARVRKRRPSALFAGTGSPSPAS